MSGPVPIIEVQELAKLLERGACLIDVREPDEFIEARAPGASLIPLQSLPSRMGEVTGDQTVYVICKSGGRSEKAVEFLRANGIDAINVAGGTLAWLEAGFPHESGPNS